MRRLYEQIAWARDRGINFVDTAERYPVPLRREMQGETKRILGAWIANNRARRAGLVIASESYVPAFGSWRYDPSKERGETPILEQIGALRRGLVARGAPCEVRSGRPRSANGGSRRSTSISCSRRKCSPTSRP